MSVLSKWLEKIGSQGSSAAEQPSEKEAGQPQLPSLGYEPAPQEVVDPGVVDIGTASYEDWKNLKASEESSVERKKGSLADFLTQLQSVYGAMTGKIDTATKEGVADVEGKLSATLADSEAAAGTAHKDYAAALGDIQTGLEKARTIYNNSLAQIKETRGTVDASKAAVYETAAKGMSDFRNKSVDMQVAWLGGQQKQTQTMKSQTAARLREQGYSSDEIDGEMRKIDWDQGVTKTSQMAQFQTEEEQRRGQLQLGYDQLTSNMEATVAGLHTTLTQTEVGLGAAAAGTEMTAGAQSAAIRDLDAKVDQWKTGINSAARAGAVDASSQYRLSGLQLQSATDAMNLQGYGSYTEMMQNLDEAFTPLAPLLLSMFSLNLGLEDRKRAYEGTGLAEGNTGLSLYQAGANSIISQVHMQNEEEQAYGMM